MKNTIKILISIVFLIGLLFITDSYAEKKKSKYISLESSTDFSLPGAVKKDALMDRYERYTESQSEFEEQLEASNDYVVSQQVGDDFVINVDFDPEEGGRDIIGEDELEDGTLTDAVTGNPTDDGPNDKGPTEAR